MLDSRTMFRATRTASLSLFMALLIATPIQDAQASPPPIAEDTFFETVVQQAEQLAQRPYETNGPELPAVVADLPEHGTRSIPFNPEKALWTEVGLPIRFQLFHRGAWFDKPVRVSEIVGNKAQPVPYSPERFDLTRSGLSPEMLRENIEHAGVTLHFLDPKANTFREKLSFLGASYFRAIGSDHHWGASARGIAINTFLEGVAEEFPAYEAFWLQRPEPNDKEAVVYALLNGPSVTGAYRFVARPGDQTAIHTEVALFFRQNVDTPVQKLGLAPLTSMFLMGEEQPGRSGAWRPEVHDSDGLLMIDGTGEHTWRPLDNPAASRVSRFSLTNPKGFGLIQRDRRFESYMDPALEYHRRPSVWVQTHGDWGQGWVELIEFHSEDEDFDNLGAFWVPKDDAMLKSGQRFDLAYTLWFCDDQPPVPSAGRFTDTFRGVPQALFPNRRERGALRFVLLAEGGGLEEEFAGLPEVVSSVTNGQVIGSASAVRIPELGKWQVMVDARPYDNGNPMELRVHLKRGDNVLTETWSYRWDWGLP
ncbi:MAG: glucan biosynthesis protein [Planctomycetota bacterium]